EDAGARQKALGEAHVLLRRVGAVHDAVGPDAAREEERRIAIPGPELEHLLRADRLREQKQVSADERSDDGKSPLGGEGLHLEANGIAVVVELAQIVLDLRIHDLRHATSCRNQVMIWA